MVDKAEKAPLFSDARTLGRILATDSPRDHEALGRQLAGFDEPTWEREGRGPVPRPE